MEELLPFLKKYSEFDIDFIKKFIEIRKGDNKYYPFTIDLDTVATWLKTRKRKLKETLMRSYKKNIDYIVLTDLATLKGAAKSKGSGGHNKELVLLSPDTFKMMTMKSKTKEAEKVRYYYITLEKLVEIYKDDIIKKQNKKIETLERNLKKVKYPVKGAVYIMDVSGSSNLGDSNGFKIGKTKNMNIRVNAYNTHHKDNPKVVYVFYTNNIHRLEKCIMLALEDYQYRNNKEYYKASKKEIIEAMKDCEHIITKFKKDNNKSKKIFNRNKLARNIKDTSKIIFTTFTKYSSNQKGGNIENLYSYNLNKLKYDKLKIICI